MNLQLSKSPIGLEGIPAAETVLSRVDGERGELIIAGERVGDLVRKTGFEGVIARLWSGGTGRPVGEAEVRATLGVARERAYARLADLLGITQGLSIVDGFRAAIAGLRAENGLSHEATIVGAFPVIVRGQGGGLYPRSAAAEKPGPAARHQCGVLHRDHARRPDDPAAGLHADLRSGPRRRMDGARPRAAADRPADTAKFSLYRPDAGLR